ERQRAHRSSVAKHTSLSQTHASTQHSRKHTTHLSTSAMNSTTTTTTAIMYDPEALQRWEAIEKRQLADDNRLRGGRRRLWWQHRQSEADPEEHWSRMQRQLLAIDHYTSYSSSPPS